MAYITVAEFRSFAKIDSTVDDEQIGVAVDAAQLEVEKFCKRSFTVPSGTSVRYFNAVSGSQVEFVESSGWRHDLANTTGLVVQVDSDGDGTYDLTLTANTHFYLEPVNTARGTVTWPYTGLCVKASADVSLPSAVPGYVPAVKVTGRFGWPAVPESVKMATKLAANAMFGRGDNRYGVVGFDGMGVSVRVQSDPQFRSLLEPFADGSRTVA